MYPVPGRSTSTGMVPGIMWSDKQRSDLEYRGEDMYQVPGTLTFHFNYTLHLITRYNLMNTTLEEQYG